MKNIRFLLIITIATSLLAGCGGAESKKEKYRERANQYYLDGNYDKARLEYKNSLQISPDDIESRFGLAQTLERMNLLQQAAGNYLKVIQLDPNHIEANVNISRFYLNARAIKRATKSLDKVLSLSPKHASAIALRGTIRALNGEKDAALADAKKALEYEPSNLDAISLLTGIYVGKKDNNKAIETLTNGIKLNPDNSELRMLLAGIYAQQGQNGRAIELLQKVITLNPQKLEFRLQLSRFYTANKATNEALRILKTAVNELDEKENAILSLTDYIARNISKDDAEKELKAYIVKYKKLYELQLGLARLYKGQNKNEEAKKIYLDIIKNEKNSKYGLTSKTQLAQIYILEKNTSKAKELIAEVLEENSQDSAALTLRGTLSLSNNELTEAISDFRTILRNQPNHPVVSKLLARAHIKNNENELAKEQYLKAVTVSPRNVQLRLEYAQLLISTGDLENAEKEIKNTVKLQPKNILALEALFKLNLSQKDNKSALNIATKIKQIDKTRPGGYYAAGIAHVADKNYKSAHSEFSQGLELAKGSVKLLTAITNNYIAQKKYIDAEKFLLKQSNINPDNVIVKNLLGEVYLSQDKINLAKAAFKKAEKLKPDWHVPYRNLASVYLKQKDTQSAIDVFIRAKEATNYNQIITYSLASLYEQSGQTDSAIKEFEDILSLSPDSAPAKNNLALMLVAYREDKDSIKKAVGLVEQFKSSSNPNYLDTLGWVMVKDGESASAVPYLSEAAKKLPDSAIVQYHLGTALFKAGENLSAKKALTLAVESKQFFRGKDEAKLMLKKIANKKG